MPQGKGSQLHNRRDYERIGKEIPKNINQNLTEQNITIIDKDIREAYQEFFGEALQEYNQRQKRADRKIKDYYEHISKSKNGEKLFYEDVLQWGTKEDFKNNPALKETAKECLKEYVESFEERNPNLKLIGAYIHMDEASPHLHLDFVPVAHGYKRGLETRNSLDKAMKEMGYIPEKESRKNNATKLWKENERKYFGDICRSRGLEVEEERHYDRKSLSVEEYKEAKDKMLGEIEREKGLLEQGIADKKHELETKEKQIVNATKHLEKVLDTKTKAAIIKKPGLFSKGELVTYHKKSLETIEAIGREARDYMESARSKLDQLTEREQAVEVRERQINPLFNEAKEANDRAQELKDEQESYIFGTAEKMAQEMFERFLDDEFDSRLKGKANRLERFCDKIKLNDGRTILEVFNEQEQARQQNLNKLWEDRER